MAKRTRKPEPHLPSSGNVFKDLNLPNSEEELTKSSLLWELAQAIRARGLKQTEAARLLGIPQPQVSLLLRGRTAGFSVQRLSILLRRLGKSVTIVVSDEPPQAEPQRIPVVRDSEGLVSRLMKDLASTHVVSTPDYAGSARSGRRAVERKKK